MALSLRLALSRSLFTLLLRLSTCIIFTIPTQQLQVSSFPFSNNILPRREPLGSSNEVDGGCERVAGLKLHGGQGRSMLEGWSVAVVAVGMFVMVLVSGVLSGLTLGLMSIDMTRLHVLAVSGTPKQKRMANTILPVKKYPYFLLCSLLIASVLVNEMLPIMNARLFGESYKALFISAALVIVFGEIIPQAVFPRYALELGSSMIWLVYLCMLICSIPALILSSMLHYALRSSSGSTHNMFTSSELVTFIELHSEDNNLHEQREGALESRTVALIKGVVEAQELVVGDVVKGLEMVYMVNGMVDATREVLKRVLEGGYSRIPVYEPSTEVYEDSGLRRLKFLGYLHTRNFFELDREPTKKVRNIGVIPLPIIDKDRPLYDILAIFKTGKARMALVADPAKDRTIDTEEFDNFFHGQHTNPRIQLEVGMGPSTVSYLQNDILWTNHPLSAQKEIIGIVTMDDIIKAVLGSSRCSYPRRTGELQKAEKAKVDEEWKYAVDAATVGDMGFLPHVGAGGRYFRKLEKSTSGASTSTGGTSTTAFSTMSSTISGSGSGYSEEGLTGRKHHHHHRPQQQRQRDECTLIPLKELEVNLIERGGSQISLGCIWEDIQQRNSAGVNVVAAGGGAISGDIGGIMNAGNVVPADVVLQQQQQQQIGPSESEVGVGTALGIGNGAGGLGVHHTGTLRRRFSFEGGLDEKDANLLEAGN